MSLRTKSRTSQWGCWALIFLAGFAAYVIALRLIGSETGAWLILARQNVVAFAAVAFVFGWIAYECRWDGFTREVESGTLNVERGTLNVEREAKAEASISSPSTPNPQPPAPNLQLSTFNLQPSTFNAQLSPGEAEWREARQLPHQPIPDFTNDREYMELLVKAADLGHPEALAKLGEYALRRSSFVEAYYWFYLAREKGMRNLDHQLRGIRLEWVRLGCLSDPAQDDSLLDSEKTSIANALLDRDSRRNVKEASEFLASVGF